MKIAVVVGHERKKPGAVLNMANGLCTEYEYNKIVASNMKYLGMGYNSDVRIFFRDGIGRMGVHNQVLAYAPDAGVELHFNSSENPNAAGALIVCTEKNSTDLFVEAMLQKMVELFGGENRGVLVPNREDSGWFNVQYDFPFFLIEPFFGSNPLQAYKAMESIPKYSTAILDCLYESFGINNATGS